MTFSDEPYHVRQRKWNEQMRALLATDGAAYKDYRAACERARWHMRAWDKDGNVPAIDRVLAAVEAARRQHDREIDEQIASVFNPPAGR